MTDQQKPARKTKTNKKLEKCCHIETEFTNYKTRLRYYQILIEEEKKSPSA